jgi:hypothetical protein
MLYPGPPPLSLCALCSLQLHGARTQPATLVKDAKKSSRRSTPHAGLSRPNVCLPFAHHPQSTVNVELGPTRRGLDGHGLAHTHRHVRPARAGRARRAAGGFRLAAGSPRPRPTLLSSPAASLVLSAAQDGSGLHACCAAPRPRRSPRLRRAYAPWPPCAREMTCRRRLSRLSRKRKR